MIRPKVQDAVSSSNGRSLLLLLLDGFLKAADQLSRSLSGLSGILACFHAAGRFAGRVGAVRRSRPHFPSRKVSIVVWQEALLLGYSVSVAKMS